MVVVVVVCVFVFYSFSIFLRIVKGEGEEMLLHYKIIYLALLLVFCKLFIAKSW